MTALTKNAPRTRVGEGKRFRDPVAASMRIFAGSMVALNAAGNAVKAIPTATRVRGVALAEVDNSDGAAGAASVDIERGPFLFANDTTNAVTRVHIGGTVYVVDDNTVGSASAGTIAAGKCLDVTPEGVVVEIL
ncbi:hypothetical protein [Pseudotabrizicola algicola]|uniref:DUF2190 family protein n=1 Tax=Pseudotabrizicola algicola TaxID=2709381 RepID=A0A6B3RRZ6_9RHOB|nr:hypothetical protein [Pseudotabrizicola algicola]NEX47608.1 hypothetical protein [Pseudotabrizicola algicola]